ncbi:MAG: hypothetical protein FVQ85_01530 [Planctomycetes bacterium]|nr:hypothetical protein [Planctomycetota bacterium]
MDMELLGRFRKANTDGLPEFSNYDKPLEMGLWVLWVVKEKLRISRLKADEIAHVILHAKEVSVSTRAITGAFNRAQGKIHKYKESTGTFYEIMKSGKEHLVSQAGAEGVKVHYFEPGKKHSSKRILTENILDELKGDLKILDPYCDLGALDILSKSKKRRIKCLTKIENLRPKTKQRFLRELQDFKSEYTNMEFRSYSKSEIHDRYIVSLDRLVILGYSLKDLGAKESFAIALDKKMCSDIFDVLVENFNRRWKVASPL